MPTCTRRPPSLSCPLLALGLASALVPACINLNSQPLPGGTDSDTSTTDATTTTTTSTTTMTTMTTTTMTTMTSTTMTTMTSTTEDPTTTTTTTTGDPECDMDLVCDEVDGEDLVGCLHDCGGCTPTGTCVENKETPYSCPEDCPATGCNQDGKIDALTEQCDDGNNVDEDACTNGCALNVCGDGVVFPVEAGGSEECDDGNAEAGDGCAGCLLEGRTVFVTSIKYEGNLGGLAGADAECMARANGKLTGQYKAWLSDGMESAGSRLGLMGFKGPFELVDGTLVAMGWDDLVDGGLMHAIDMDENGMMKSSTVWTNTNPDGTGGAEHCNNWSDATSMHKGGRGTSDQADGNWTTTTPDFCNGSFSLYCFQVN